MPDTFTPLRQWLQAPVMPLEEPEAIADPAGDAELYSALRRLRAAVLEALDAPADCAALQRVRFFADALIAQES